MGRQTIQEQLTANMFEPASAFNLSYTPIDNTFMFFVDGGLQRLNYDYVRSGTEVITTTTIPSGINVLGAYQYDEKPEEPAPDCPPDYNLVRTQETLTPVGTGAMVNTFTFSQPPYPSRYFIFIDGNIQRDTIDYNIVDDVLTTTEAIPSDVPVYADYYYREERDTVLPVGRRGSTTINHAVTSYELLAERIKMQLGYPVVRIELCDDQIYDFIDQAVEWYTKYAGHTREYLMFDSQKTYKCGLGVKLDNLFSALYNYECCGCEDHLNKAVTQYYDCDLNTYRKVIDVFSVDPVEHTGTSVLFTLDYMFAQQTYFSYMLGSFGFDLITWHILKEWLNLREKLFATRPYVRFDKRTQYMRLIPEPTAGSGGSVRRSYIGVVGAWVEQPIAFIVQERWVLQYALALTKISLAHMRGKYGTVQLFGGGGPAAQDLMTQGMKEKEELEKELMEGAGEAEPSPWFIG